MSGQAKSGGEQGINGEWYEGGQFLPSSENTVKGANKPIILKGSRVCVSPYVYGAAPADDMLSIYDRIEHFTTDNRRECQYQRGFGFIGLLLSIHRPVFTRSSTGECAVDEVFYNFIADLVDRFNNGERFYPLEIDPRHYKNNKQA